MDFSEIKGVIFDMDGVLYRGSVVLPGVQEVFAFLRGRGIRFAMATNNSSRSQVDYVQKLADMGVGEVLPEQIVTSGTATADYLQARYPSGTGMFVVGGQGLVDILESAGFSVVDENVSVVVVGIDRDLTYPKLKTATQLILDGAEFVGTNGDVTFPSEDGLSPGAGSILALLATATGIQPTVIGKPEGLMFETALRSLGTEPDQTLMVGDRLATDILGAKNVGIKAALVLTGVTDKSQLNDSEVQPDAVFEGLPELLAAWQS